MNYKPLLVTSILAINTLLFAQSQKTPQLIPCNTFAAMEEVFKKDPAAKTRYDLIKSQLDLEYQQAIQNSTVQKTMAAPIYTIPVVFHILHLNGSENVSDADVQVAMTQINKDYRKTGSDIATINSNFASLYVDAEINFVLAKKDPNGKCTNGIIRHYDANTNWDQTNPNYAYSGSGTNRWPTNKYLNVYVVKCIASPNNPCPPVSSFIGGYTYLPGSFGTNASEDAIVYRSDQLTGLDARALSHEIGHWLGLSHTFGPTNSPGISCGNDGLGDTPVTKGFYSTCPGNNAGPFSGCSTFENMENFMDYSACPKMFTQNQVTAMRTALTSPTSGRNNLITTTNAAATGVSVSYTCTAVADFTSNKIKNCVGNPVLYTSKSYIGTSGSVSWIFQGGVPATSTSTAPSVTYATPGTYSVSITATNPQGTNTMNKTSYITISNGSGGTIIPHTIDFESGIPSNASVVNTNAGSVTWMLNSTTGGNSTANSIYIPASSSTGGHTDAFETPTYNFQNTTGASLSYYYAYAKKTSTQIDSFKVQYSLDCGGSWTTILGVPSLNTMATNSGGTTAASFIPTSAQWKQTTLVSALLTALNNKPSVKFRFYFKSDPSIGSSNNMYLDQINLSGVVGLNDLENELGLLIYPNPTNSGSTIDLTIQNNEQIKITVLDVLGRVVEEIHKPTINGTHMQCVINKTALYAPGVYIVNIDINHQRISKKIIIE